MFALLRAIMFVAFQKHHICVTQQVNRDYLTKFETQKLWTPPEKHILFLKSAGAVSSLRLSQSQASRQGKGKLLQDFLTPALHGAVCASASGSTEN